MFAYFLNAPAYSHLTRMANCKKPFHPDTHTRLKNCGGVVDYLIWASRVRIPFRCFLDICGILPQLLPVWGHDEASGAGHQGYQGAH